MKNKESRPDVYKIIFRAGRWITKSSRYYTAFDVCEVLLDFYHTFVVGHVHAKSVKIFKILKYDRFADKWEQQHNIKLERCPDHIRENITIKNNKIIFHEI